MKHPQLFLLAIGAGAVLLCSAAGRAQAPTDAQQQPATPPTHVPVPATRPDTPAAVSHRQWSPVVEPGETVPSLTVRDKLIYPAHEEFRWTTPVGILYSAWYGVLRDSDPKFGVNAEGWGERVGAAALRQGISRELSDSFLPILLHEDPRYYRKAYGTYGSRAEYAFTRVIFTRTDSGGETFNYSGVLGRGMGAALTQTYYPEVSVTPGIVFRTWGYSLLSTGGVDVLNEFLPDIKRKLHHKSQ